MPSLPTGPLGLRNILVVLTALLLVFGGLRLSYLRIFVFDRQALSRDFTSYPDRGTEEFPLFLREVARVTKPGDRIALVVPMRRWDDGYSYAYYRASFVLAGREVLPVVWRDDTLLRENLDRATHVAAWRVRFQHPQFHTRARGRGGELLVRRRS